MIKVIKKGLYTSIQDLGRIGYRNYGVPVAGAMDSSAAKLSNLIIENEDNAAVMEITLQGPILEFMSTAQIAITGADLSPTLNHLPIKMNESVTIKKGDIIQFKNRKTGVRSYLAIKGGFKTEKVFGSRSNYHGITQNSTISNGDKLPIVKTSDKPIPNKVQLSYQESNLNHKVIAVYKGPEYDLLNESQKKELFDNDYTLGLNNRMAYQLKEMLENNLSPILSSAVIPGTVQLTPSGKIILLMRDCQTTGGYPRILQLSENSINILAQKMQHDLVRFRAKKM